MHGRNGDGGGLVSVSEPHGWIMQGKLQSTEKPKTAGNCNIYPISYSIAFYDTDEVCEHNCEGTILILHLIPKMKTNNKFQD